MTNEEPMQQADATSPRMFDDHQDSWQQWQSTPWGRLRYDIVAELLDAHLPPPGSVLGTDRSVLVDVGGGDGADSVRLAGPGRAVVVADSSSRMLERVAARVEDLPLGSPAEVRTVLTDLAGLADHPELRAVAPGGADVVLCHNVLQYCPDLDEALGQVLAVAAPGALVSIATSNPVTRVLTAAVRDLDPDTARAELDAATMYAPTFDHHVRRIPWQDGVAALERAGCTVVARYGVLCVNHLIVDDARKQQPQFFAALRRLELELAGLDPYRDIAAMWLVVARAGTTR